MEQLEKAVKTDKYNVEIWNALLSSQGPVEKIRSYYEAFLEVFPTAARIWKTFIEKEISVQNYKYVETLFKKCLFSCLDVDLWKSYISYIRIAKKGTPNELRDINTAYEFVIKNVGMDVNSANVWCDHISFLKNELRGIPLEEKKKAIRSVYHLALVTPMSGVDQIWREYDSWEHINDKNLAKGMLAGLYQQHQNAKSVCLHRKRLKRSILPGMLARPPYGSSSAHERDYLQVIHWSKLIDYEKTNPQKLNSLQLEERVVFTYKQALMYLRFYPEIWDSYAKYFHDRHTLEDAVGVYNQAISAMPDNMDLNFLYAEFLERNKKFPESRKVYEDLLKINKHPLIHVQLQRFARRCESKESARKVFVDAKNEKTCSYHIYLNSAQIEQFQNKEPKIAQKILNLGLSRFNQEPEFVSKYLDLMEYHTDINNLREIYERVLTEMDNSISDIIWQKYVDFEARSCSDLKTIDNLEARRTQALELPETKVQINRLKRYSYLDLIPCPKEFLSTMEKVLHTKIQDIPVETNSVFKKSQKQKSYTFKGETKFYNPDLDSMIEIKPGVPFMKKATLLDTHRAEWIRSELSSIMKQLLSQLPHSDSVQGIPIKASFLLGKIKNSEISSDEKNKVLKVNDSEEKSIGTKTVKEKIQIDGDLFQQRRKSKRLEKAS